MNFKWEHEDEYLKLDSEFRRARKVGDIETMQQIKPRLDELDGMMWKFKTNGFPELAPYSSLVEALEQLCLENRLPFPDLNNREQNFTGKGDWEETNRFIFGVSNRERSVQIFPMEDRGYIDIELYEGDFCYKGQTSSVLESALVLSKWYMQECSIRELHRQFPWMPVEPFSLSRPRVTYK
jgi:hypothetical protein